MTKGEVEVKIYSLEYDYETYHFNSLEALLKSLRSWWVADGRPWWYDCNGRRSHFPTQSEIEYAILTEGDFYRDYGTSNYIIVNAIRIHM